MSEKSKKDSQAFQSYLDNIKTKTGKSPDEFVKLACEKGLEKHGDIIAWLKNEFALGHGHANAIALVIKQHGQSRPSPEDAIAEHFTGKKAVWRTSYDALFAAVRKLGADVEIDPGKTYLSLIRGTKKFGIVQVSTARMDVGIKLKGVPPTERLEASGSWNAMVTHRVRISDPGQVDQALLVWLQRAYDAV